MTNAPQLRETQVHLLGNDKILLAYKVAFLCSRSVPASHVPQVRSWTERQREQGGCVISGFHSPVEKQVLEILLAGRQPVILVLACGIQPALVKAFQPHLAASRLLVLTRYAPSVTHPCQEKSYQRNRLMLEIADEVVVGYASPGGAVERLCEEFKALRPLRWLAENVTR